MKRRLRGIALILAGSLGHFTVPAAAAPEQQLVLVAYRTTTGAASLDLQIDAPPGRRPSVIAIVMATVDRSRITQIDLAGVLLSGAADRMQVRANGQRTTLCEKGVCLADTSTQSAGSAVTIRNAAGDDELNVMFVVARGASVSYRATPKGWAIKRIAMPFRVVAGEDTATAGAYGAGSGAEISADVSATGGGTGSIAVSEPPCSESTSGAVSRGVGTLTLEGGRTKPTFTCPTSRGALASWAERRTTWRVTGKAVGETTQSDARLFVMDLPRRLPLPSRWPWR